MSIETGIVRIVRSSLEIAVESKRIWRKLTMKVKYKAGSIYGSGLTDFPYKEGDYVTIVVRYWTSKEDDEDIYYHGYIKGKAFGQG